MSFSRYFPTPSSLKGESMLDQLKRLIVAYEQDPKHLITEEHCRVRQTCVTKYGVEVVKEHIRTIYQELHNEQKGTVEDEHFTSDWVSHAGPTRSRKGNKKRSRFFTRQENKKTVLLLCKGRGR